MKTLFKKYLAYLIVALLFINAGVMNYTIATETDPNEGQQQEQLETTNPSVDNEEDEAVEAAEEKTAIAPTVGNTTNTMSSPQGKPQQPGNSNGGNKGWPPHSKTYTIKYFAEEGGSIQGNAVQNVKHGGSGTPVTAVPNKGYEFEKWKQDNNTNATRKETNVKSNLNYTAIFKKKVDLTSYTVKYVDNNNDDLKPDKTVGNQIVGSTVTETALSIPGYTVDQNTKSLKLNKWNNVIIFKYTPVKTTKYIVKYIDNNDNTLYPNKVIENQIVGSVVTETALSIPGYTVDQNIKNLTLGKNNNVIKFIYTPKCKPNKATIKYVANEGGSVNPTSETMNPRNWFSKPKGSTATADEGYIFTNWTDKNGNIVSKKAKFVPKKWFALNILCGTTTYYANFAPVETPGEPDKPEPSIAIEKYDDWADDNENGYADVGEKIYYTITVTNTGEVDLTNVKVTDSMIDLNETIDNLPVGESVTFTGSYTMTEDDIDKGQVVNTALVIADELEDSESASATTDLPIAPEVPEEPEEPEQPGGGTYIPSDPLNISLGVEKDEDFVDEDNNGYANIGDTISYTITVTNTGNVSLSNITVQDPLLGYETIIAQLAVGETWTYSGSYNITQDDIDNGFVDNTVIVTTGRIEEPIEVTVTTELEAKEDDDEDEDDEIPEIPEDSEEDEDDEIPETPEDSEEDEDDEIPETPEDSEEDEDDEIPETPEDSEEEDDKKPQGLKVPKDPKDPKDPKKVEKLYFKGLPKTGTSSTMFMIYALGAILLILGVALFKKQKYNN